MLINLVDFDFRVGRLNTFEQKGSEEEGGGEGGGGATQYVLGNYKSFKWTNLTVVEGMHHFILPARYCLKL